MDKNILTEFYDVLFEVMTYAIDDRKEDFAIINYQDFFDSLYVENKSIKEIEIMNAVSNANTITVITGPLGTGKTTLTYKALNVLNDKKEYYHVFDFKERASDFYGLEDNLTNIEKNIHDILRNKLDQRFLRNTDTSRKFIFTALKEFYSIRQKSLLFKWRAKYNHQKISEDDFSKYLEQDADSFHEQYDFIMQDIKCADMLVTIKRTLDIEKLLIVFDNIDRLPNSIQEGFLQVVNDIRRGVKGEVGVIITMRNKNFNRIKEFGVGGDIIRTIDLEPTVIEYNEKEGEDSFYKKILHKRSELTQKLMLKGTPVSPEKQELVSRYRTLVSKIEKYLIELKINYLSNFSISRMMTLNYNLFIYLEDYLKKTEKKYYELKGYEFLSLFFYWLYKENFLLDITNKYDISNFNESNSKLSYLKKKMDIELVILSWLENNKHMKPRYQDIIRKFDIFGLESEDITEKLIFLYGTNENNRYIDIGNIEKRYNSENIVKENPVIKIKPLGKVFINSILTKFEFLHSALESKLNKLSVHDTASDDYDRKLSHIKKYLEKMVGIHAASLNVVKNNLLKLDERNWEEHYRNNFCIRDQLILERIIQSHLSHLHFIKPVTKMNWKNTYHDILEDYYSKIESNRNATTLVNSIIRG